MRSTRAALALTMPDHLYVEVSLTHVDNLEAALGMTSTPDLRAALEEMRPGVTNGMTTSRTAFLVLLAWMDESATEGAWPVMERLVETDPSMADKITPAERAQAVARADTLRRQDERVARLAAYRSDDDGPEAA